MLDYLNLNKFRVSAQHWPIPGKRRAPETRMPGYSRSRKRSFLAQLWHWRRDLTFHGEVLPEENSISRDSQRITVLSLKRSGDHIMRRGSGAILWSARPARPAPIVVAPRIWTSGRPPSRNPHPPLQVRRSGYGSIHQMPAPERPIAKGAGQPWTAGPRAGQQVQRPPSSYRQSQVFARQSVDLDRSPLANVGGAAG
jgi:hypothetical protein